MLDITVVIPIFNEELFLEKSVMSLLSQTYAAKEVVLVDDGSTDNSLAIAKALSENFPSVSLFTSSNQSKHEPGKKVIQAFYRGFDSLRFSWDIICKFDADIIVPPNYLETVVSAFSTQPDLGMFSGILTVEKDGAWKPESVSASNHVRGPIKAYSKKCFKAINGLQPALGWDTLDELLAQYHGFLVKTDQHLLVKHLRHTGKGYSSSAAFSKGAVFYQLGYGLFLGLIASIKWSYTQRGSLLSATWGFLSAWFSNRSKLVTRSQASFIRKHRWSEIRRRFIS